jgi:membrane-associated phospholipid phosphatase
MSSSAQATAPPQARWRHTPQGRRFNILMAAILVVLVPADYVLARHVNFNGSGHSLQVWMTALFLGAILVYCRWRPLPRLIEACELAIWADLYFDALSVLIQIAGRSHAPLVDPQLTAIDAHLHFATVAWVHFVRHIPALRIALALVYAVEPLLLLAALVVLPFMGRADASRRYVLGIVIAAVITAAAFALWPAAGPWTTEGYRATRDQVQVTTYLALLKSHAPVSLNMEDAGIVAFPSFHTLLAVLSAVALGALRRLRWPAWILAALIILSTLTTGWHYLTDVLGGLLLAAISLAAARALLPETAMAGAAPQSATQIFDHPTQEYP